MGQLARLPTQMFSDLGFQGSFVSDTLVKWMKSTFVRHRRIELKAFESPLVVSMVMDVDVREFPLLSGHDVICAM